MKRSYPRNKVKRLFHNDLFHHLMKVMMIGSKLLVEVITKEHLTSVEELAPTLNQKMKKDLEMNDHGVGQGHNPVQEVPGLDHVQQLQDLGLVRVLDQNPVRDLGPDLGLERHH